MANVHVTREPVSIDRAIRHVASPSRGAIVTFSGVVRDNSRGDRVIYLVYDAYEAMAEKELLAACQEAERRWDIACAVEHRLGRVEVGETSVVVVVASPHRADAFESSRWLMDALKQRVPIWKKEYLESGSRWIEGSNAVPSDS